MTRATKKTKAKSKTRREPACKIWDMFLRIPDPNTSDEAPIADDKWFEAKGVYPSAPAVLRLLQREVLPLVYRFHYNKKGDSVHLTTGYFFLVHDRNSGVPTTVDDKGGYIHMRVYFSIPKTYARAKKLIGGKWEMLRPIYEESADIAGIDKKLIRRRGADAIREILKTQSQLALHIVAMYTDDVDPMVLIQQVRQNLHFLANMFQIKLVG